MKNYPFSRRFIMATAAAIALPQAMVLAAPGDVSVELLNPTVAPHAIASPLVAERSLGFVSGSQTVTMLQTKFTTADNVFEIAINDTTSTSRAPKLISGLTVTLYDYATNSPVQNNGKNVVLTESSGKYTSPADFSPVVGKDYYAVVTDGKITMTTSKITGGKTKVSKSFTFVKTDDPGKSANKFGAIGGYMDSDAQVIAYNTSGTWSVDVPKGKTFKLPLLAGKYNVVVVSKDSAADSTTKESLSRNTLYKDVAVYAGQTSAPLDDLTVAASWTDSASKRSSLGLPTQITFNNTDKTLTVMKKADINKSIFASADSLTFTLIDLTTDDTLGLTGGTVLGTETIKDNTKDVSFSLKTVQAGRTLAIRVKDSAFDETTYNLAPIGALEAGTTKTAENFTADPKATVDKAVAITYKDVYGILAKNIRSIKVKYTKDADSTYRTLQAAASGVSVGTDGNFYTGTGTNKKAANGDFILSSGKITFAAGKLGTTADSVTVDINALGYKDIVVPFTLGAGAISASNSTAQLSTGDTVTVTAKDQYGNLIKGASLYLDVTPTITSTKDSITVNAGTTATKTSATYTYKNKVTAAVQLKDKTDDKGTLSVTVDLSKATDASSKVSFQFKTDSKTASSTNKIGNPIVLPK